MPSCLICEKSEFKTVATEVRDWEYGAATQPYDLVQCVACGTGTLTPFPTLEDLIAAYTEDYHGYHGADVKGMIYKTLFTIQKHLIQRSFKRYVSPGARVLDVGCGSGLFLTYFRDMGAGDLHGIDFSPHACETARARGITMFEGTFEAYPEPPKPFDIIIMNNYLEHTLDPVRELQKAAKLLKPGGVLIGEVPNFGSLDRFLFGKYWGGIHCPRHTFHFTPDGLQTAFRKGGFNEHSFFFPANPSHMALSIQNFLQRHAEDLRHNPSIKFGRMKGYGLLMLAMLPFCAALSLFKRSGFIDFSARRT